MKPKPAPPAVDRAASIAFWRNLLEEHQRSGLPQSRFATQRGIRNQRLSYWRDRIRALDQRGSTPPLQPGRSSELPQIVPVHFTNEISAPAKTSEEPLLQVRLASGVHLTIAKPMDPAVLSALLNALVTATCFR